MDLLRIIYLTANTLAVIAMLGTASIIVAHLVWARRDRKFRDERLRLSQDISRYLQSSEGGEGIVERMRRNPALAASLLAELIELIAGGQRERVLGLARAANVDRWLMKELTARKAVRRLSATEALGIFATPEAIVALGAALDDPDPDVQIAAALALANADAAPPPALLVRKLRTQRPYRPFMLRRLFTKLAPGHIDDMLEVALGHAASPLVRPYAIEAIGASGRLDMADRLTRLMSDPDPIIRATMLSAIAMLGHNPTPDVVAKALDDEAWEVRMQAILAARRLERSDLAPRIATLANDSAWWVRLRAREFLAATPGLEPAQAPSVVPEPDAQRALDRGPLVETQGAR